MPVETFVAHRGAMRLIERLLQADASTATAEAVVRPGGPFVGDASNGWPVWAGVELMAQTISAWSGHRAWQAGRAPGIGLLLGVKHYEAFCGVFKTRERLTIHVRNLLAGEDLGAGEALALSAFDARILRGEQELARARLSVMEPDASLLAQIASPAPEAAA